MADTVEDVGDKNIDRNNRANINVQLLDRRKNLVDGHHDQQHHHHHDMVEDDSNNSLLLIPNMVISSSATAAQNIPPQVRKKTSSFQITSVTQSRLSHDGGEDSADDLDESHTEDLSSELIDCSKTTDVDNDGASSEDFSASTGVSNAPDEGQPVDSRDKINVEVAVPILITASSVSDASTAIEITPVVPVLVCETSDQHQQQWENRFKIVKIVNSEPFNRGRWIVMDFNDPPLPPHTDTKSETNAESVGSGNSSAGSSVHFVAGENHPAAAGEDPTNSYVVSQNNSSQQQKQQPNSTQPNVEYSNPNLNQQNANASGHNSNNLLPLSVNKVVGVAPIQQQNVHNIVISPADSACTIAKDASSVPSVASHQPEVANVAAQNDQETCKNLLGGGGLKNQMSFDNVNHGSPPVLKPLLDSLPDTLGVSPRMDEGNDGDEAESASGSSTVAIDNKIEQAMDLVKSHLMFAVREEVDVLKEKITELVDKISQLEFENGILKESASQETLSKISQQPSQQNAPTSTSNAIQHNNSTAQATPQQQSQPHTNAVHS